MSFTLVSEHVCHGGVQRFYEHVSFTIGLPMRFSVFLPQACALERVPALLYLAGLTLIHAAALRWQVFYASNFGRLDRSATGRAPARPVFTSPSKSLEIRTLQGALRTIIASRSHDRNSFKQRGAHDF